MAQPHIDTKPPMTYIHLHVKLKKLQLEEDRLALVERDNRMLLEKIAYIMRTKGKIDNINRFEYRSRNHEKRIRELIKVAKENMDIVRRITRKRPEYEKQAWDRDWQATVTYMSQISMFPTGWWTTDKYKGRPIMNVPSTSKNRNQFQSSKTPDYVKTTSPKNNLPKETNRTSFKDLDRNSSEFGNISEVADKKFIPEISKKKQEKNSKQTDIGVEEIKNEYRSISRLSKKINQISEVEETSGNSSINDNDTKTKNSAEKNSSAVLLTHNNKQNNAENDLHQMSASSNSSVSDEQSVSDSNSEIEEETSESDSQENITTHNNESKKSIKISTNYINKLKISEVLYSSNANNNSSSHNENIKCTQSVSLNKYSISGIHFKSNCAMKVMKTRYLPLAEVRRFKMQQPEMPHMFSRKINLTGSLTDKST